MYVAFISYGCFKSRSGDVAHVAYVAIVSEACCKHMFRVFQMFQRFVSSHHLCFADACCKCVYLDVVDVSHIRCMCFIWMFAYGCSGFQVFSGVFSIVLEACFKQCYPKR